MQRHQQADVTFGLVLPPHDEPARLWDAARVAEQHGFHSVWATDSTLPGFPWLDGLSVLGGIAAATTTIQLGTSVYILARRNPVLLAHTLATLDHLSGGRLTFGVGVGENGFRPQEYAISGVSMSRRGAVTDEYLGLMQRLWTESAVSHHGRYFQCDDITVEPKPSRQGKIPIWIGGKADGPLRRAAACGDGWLPAFITPEEYRQRWTTLSGHLDAAGRDPDRMTSGYYTFAAIGRTREAARDVLAPGVEAIFHAPFAYFESLCLYGTADDWLEQIDHFTAAGARHVNVLLYTRDLVSDVQHIGQEVVSRLAGAAAPSVEPIVVTLADLSSVTSQTAAPVPA